MKIGNWTCTDVDNQQYGRKINDNTFEFKEWDKEYNHLFDTTEEKIDLFDNSTYWIQDTIDISDYSDEDINDFIDPYYNSIEDIIEIYGKEDANWIIAECIFEQENGNY
jgi:hypothetical protein